MPKLTPEAMEATIRRYFQACNDADYEGLVSSFTPDGVHYFPAGLPNVPWRGAEAIAKGWIWCVEELGSRWTIERVLASSTAPEAVIEWTHWKTKSQSALRGDEWYIFCEETGLIKEIRAFYASPADRTVPENRLVDFDYEGRGYHLNPPA